MSDKRSEYLLILLNNHKWELNYFHKSVKVLKLKAWSIKREKGI